MWCQWEKCSRWITESISTRDWLGISGEMIAHHASVGMPSCEIFFTWLSDLQRKTGEVEVEYLDGTNLCVNSRDSSIRLKERNGLWKEYRYQDHLPSSVQERLGDMPLVIEALLRPSHPSSHSEQSCLTLRWCICTYSSVSVWCSQDKSWPHQPVFMYCTHYWRIFLLHSLSKKGNFFIAYYVLHFWVLSSGRSSAKKEPPGVDPEECSGHLPY